MTLRTFMFSAVVLTFPLRATTRPAPNVVIQWAAIVQRAITTRVRRDPRGAPRCSTRWCISPSTMPSSPSRVGTRRAAPRSCRRGPTPTFGRRRHRRLPHRPRPGRPVADRLSRSDVHGYLGVLGGHVQTAGSRSAPGRRGDARPHGRRRLQQRGALSVQRDAPPPRGVRTRRGVPADATARNRSM